MQLGHGPFETENLFAQHISYLSESVILILTKEREFRIFYTQKFNHGEYNASNYKSQENEKPKQQK